MPIEVEIEQRFRVTGRGVFVSLRFVDDTTDLVLPENPTLAGVPIERWIAQPRQLGLDGFPRTDIFIVKLVDPAGEGLIHLGRAVIA